MVSAFVVKKML